MLSQLTFSLALAASATAHMVLEYPIPFNNGSVTNSPLTPEEFPCKQGPSVYSVTRMNQWNAGETKTISFFGSVVHGGGSCQFSITTDPEPNKSSQWKVIQSVIGGCPSNITGNFEVADRWAHDAATFPVQMPKDIPSGRYTFAWTWLNKVGNREFYMNCAPIQVGSGTGGGYSGSASDALAKLPDMFVANLPADSCHTTQGQDFDYPNPGANVVRGKQATPHNDLDGPGCASMTKMGAGKGQIGSPTNPTSPAKSSAAYGAPAPAQTTGGYSQPVSAQTTGGYGQPDPAKPASGYGQPSPVESSSADEQPAPEESSPADEQPAPSNPTGGYGQPAPAKPTSGYGQPAPAKPASGYGQSNPVESSPADEQSAPEESSSTDEQPASEDSSQVYGNKPSSNYGGVFAPGASKAPIAPSTAPIVQPTAPATFEPTPTGSNYGSTPTGDSECTPCSNDGAVVCIGTKQFGICNRGCVVAQALATGTKCSNGTVGGLNGTTTDSYKRSIHFPRGYLYRRHGSADN